MKGTFRLIGDCVGRTVEVDERTQKMELLKEGRIKILLDKSVNLPVIVPVWVEDLRFMVQVEIAEEDTSIQEGRDGRGKVAGRTQSCRSQQGRRDEDDEVISGLNLKSPAPSSKEKGLWANEEDRPMEQGPFTSVWGDPIKTHVLRRGGFSWPDTKGKYKGMLGHQKGNDNSSERGEDGDSGGEMTELFLASRRPIRSESEEEMSSDADSRSSRGSSFNGDDNRRTDESLLDMAEIVKSSLEREGPDGKDVQMDCLTSIGPVSGGCNSREINGRTKEDCLSASLDIEEGGSRGTDRAPPRNSQGWISVMKR